MDAYKANKKTTMPTSDKLACVFMPAPTSTTPHPAPVQLVAGLAASVVAVSAIGSVVVLSVFAVLATLVFAMG